MQLDGVSLAKIEGVKSTEHSTYLEELRLNAGTCLDASADPSGPRIIIAFGAGRGPFHILAKLINALRSAGCLVKVGKWLVLH